MTDTSLEIEMHAGIADVATNSVVCQTIADAWAEVGPVNFSDEAKAAAKHIAPCVPGCDVNDPLNDNVPVFVKANFCVPASSDVGDVSYCVPTGALTYITNVKATAMHSWQMVAQTRSAIAHEGTINCAKVMALAGLKFIMDPALVEAAWKEHKDNGLVYDCLMPADLKPKLDRK